MLLKLSPIVAAEKDGRNRKVIAMRKAGRTLLEIARHYRISQTRVRQIIKNEERKKLYERV